VKLGNRSTWRFPVQWTAEVTIQEGIRGQCQAIEACESQLTKDISLVLHSGLIPCSSQGLLLSALFVDSAHPMLERTRKPFCRVSSLLVRISVHGVGKPRPMHVLPHGLRKREDLVHPSCMQRRAGLQRRVDVIMCSIVKRVSLVWFVATCDHQVIGYAICTP
jgi:hypothetical protein